MAGSSPLAIGASRHQASRASASARRRAALAVMLGAMAVPSLALASLEPISVSSIVSGINTANLLQPGDISAAATINSGSGGLPTLVSGGVTYNGQLVTQASGAQVAVFAFSGNVTANTITVTGGSFPVAIYAQNNLSVGTLASDGGTGGTGNTITINSAQAPAGGTAAAGGFAGGRGGAAAYVGLARNGSGPGGGTGGPVQSSGGGGGFGGAGGTGFTFPNATGGTTGTPIAGGGANGNLNSSLSGGSGGGGGSGLLGNAGGGGGGGGGAIALIAGGSLSVTGSVHANGGQGGTGYYGGGGGAGGGIILASLGSSGGGISTGGSVTADGGNSGFYTPGLFAGGGGGGGRVIDYLHQWNVSSGGTNISVLPGTYAGGAGAYNGHAGSIVIQADSTYISSGNYLKINGTGANTTLKVSTAGYSSPLLFQTNGFTINGTGALTLTNASQTINTLNGNGTIVLSGSNLTLNPPSGTSSQFTGSISGTGSLTMAGPGVFILGGTNTYSGGTFLNGGVLSLLSSTALGSGNLTFAGGTLYLPTTGITVGNAVTLTNGKTNTVLVAGAGALDSISSVISGAGGLTVAGGTANSTLNLSAANTYSGGTFVTAGILQVSGNGTLGLGGVTLNSGTQLTLNADNLTVGGLAGSGSVALGSSTLTISPNAANASTFYGGISGLGALVVGGAGPLTLAGTNTYSGGTTINSGATLLIANQNAMALGGLTNNGNFGLSGGFTNVAITGNFTQGGSGVLITRVSGINPGQFDQYRISGTAAVNGGVLGVALQNHFDATTSPNTLAVLTATGGTTGNFSSVNLGDHPINLFATTVDTGHGINLIFTLQQPSLIPYAQTPNQIAVAEYLNATDGYQNRSQTSPSYQTLLNALDGSYSSQIPTILDMLSPIDLQAFPQVSIQNGINLDQTFSQHAQELDSGMRGWNNSGFSMLNPGQQSNDAMALHQMLQDQSQMVALDAGLPSYLGYSPSGSSSQLPWSAFITGAAQFDNYSDASSIGSPNITTENATIGADYAFLKPLSVGVLFNYAHSNINLDSFGSSGRVNSYTPGIYANFYMNHWFVDAVAAYTYSDNHEQRQIAFNNFAAAANGNFSGSAYNGSLDMGYRLFATGPTFAGLSAWTIVPMLSLGYTHASFNSFAETGAGPAGLDVNSVQADSFRSTLSATFLYTVKLSHSSSIEPGILLGWRHEYLNNSQGITSQLQGAGTGTFTVNTAAPVRDVAVIAPSLTVNFTPNISGFVNYELDLGSNKFHAQQVFAGLSIAF